MIEKLSEQLFAQARREKLLDYPVYEENFDEATETIEVILEQLRQPSEVLAAIPLTDRMHATRGLAWEALDHLSNLYSGGHDLGDLRAFYPTVLQSWETFAKYSEEYQHTKKTPSDFVAHLPLKGEGLDRANRLVCFAVLLGWTPLIERLVPIIDFANPVRDAFLERLLSAYLPGRDGRLSECTRPPYANALRIIEAAPADRSAQMAEYLAQWYRASKREPYYESHKRHTAFFGYWSWEAAALSHTFGIDDTPYRDAQFYPADLVEFASYGLS